MKKPTIIHIINSLTTGGAEILLKNTVNKLNDFGHIIVYLNKPDTLIHEFEGKVEFICLHHTGWKNILATIMRLRRIIKKRRPLLVHSHLQTATIIARLATKKSIPLFSTLHSTFSKDAFQQNRKSIWVERLTLKRRHMIIGVSAFVLKDYFKFIPFKGKSFVLYNFLPDVFFKNVSFREPGDHLKCVALGNLKEAKNYPYLLDVFSQLKGENICLDIYGAGNLKDELQNQINRGGLSVKLCGPVKDSSVVFKEYDLFVQASIHEGFGLSVIEAMAAGLPTCLSDIEVFREITGGHAHFFPLTDPVKAADVILRLKENVGQRNLYIKPAYDYCKTNYSQEKYMNDILRIYNNVISKN